VYLIVRATFFWGEILIFERKTFLDENNILKKSILFKNTFLKILQIFLKYFSKEKSPVLSQVGRSPTCIGADTGGWVS